MNLTCRWHGATVVQRRLATAAFFAVVVAVAAWMVWGSAATETDVVLRPGADGAFVKSHEGTVPDGDLRLWGNGKTLSSLGGDLPYGELRRMFDYFLSAWGEQDLNAIVERIDREIQSQLPVPQSDAAKALLRKYLKYKEALVALDKTPSAQGQGVEAIRKRFEGMQALRGQFFTPREDEAMFGFDDAYDRDAIARLEIHQNTSLSEAQKRERMAVLDAAMPAAVKAEREAPRQIINLENQVAALRAQGATDAQVFNVRAKALNPEAAQRLAELDRDEQAWQARIADYQRERQRVLQSNANSSGSERESSLAQLQQSRFSLAEIPRLVAYESTN